MRYLPHIVIAISIFIILGFVIIFSALQSSNLPSGYEYFFAENCPHCQKVEDFLKDWPEKEKIKLEKKEVHQNQDNARLFLKRVARCGLSQEQAGVPFLFTPEGKCIMGDEPIIDYLKGLKI